MGKSPEKSLVDGITGQGEELLAEGFKFRAVGLHNLEAYAGRF